MRQGALLGVQRHRIRINGAQPVTGVSSIHDEQRCLMVALTAAEVVLHYWPYSLATCSIPDDCIDFKRYPLFIARAVLQELVESLQSNRGVTPC